MEWEDDRESGGKKAEVGEREGGGATSWGNPDKLQEEGGSGRGKKDVGGCEVKCGADQPVGIMSHDFQLETMNCFKPTASQLYLVASNFDDRQSEYEPAQTKPSELACPIPSQHC